MMSWNDFMKQAHQRGLPREAFDDAAKAEEPMLADPTCPVCITWNDGDPACPQHGGTYQEGLVCPATGDENHIVIVCQSGAAWVCFTCGDAEEGGEA
jgi:hypothetical protein